MKKVVLLLAFGLFSMSMAAKSSFRPHWKYMDEPVKITVRGIDFFIFPDGEFDFNAHQRRNRHYYGPREFGIRIDRDRFGKIRRIGNVHINYNRHRQVTRIGQVFIKYNRRGLVVKIGDLRIKYAGRKYAVIRHRHRHKHRHGGLFAGIRFSTSPAYVYDGPFIDDPYDGDWRNDDYYGDSDYYFKTPSKNKKHKIKGRRR